jgi:hypothetical protein
MNVGCRILPVPQPPSAADILCSEEAVNVASIEKRTCNAQVRWYARYRDPGGTQLVKAPYAYLKPDDELAGRTAMTETMRSIVPDVYPICTRQASE